MTSSSAFCSVSKAAFRATLPNLYNLKTFFIYFLSLILFQSHMYNYEKNNTQFFFLCEDYLVFFIITSFITCFFSNLYIYLYTLYYFYVLVFVGFYPSIVHCWCSRFTTLSFGWMLDTPVMANVGCGRFFHGSVWRSCWIMEWGICCCFCLFQKSFHSWRQVQFLFLDAHFFLLLLLVLLGLQPRRYFFFCFLVVSKLGNFVDHLKQFPYTYWRSTGHW